MSNHYGSTPLSISAHVCATMPRRHPLTSYDGPQNGVQQRRIGARYPRTAGHEIEQEKGPAPGILKFGPSNEEAPVNTKPSRQSPTTGGLTFRRAHTRRVNIGVLQGACGVEQRLLDGPAMGGSLYVDFLAPVGTRFEQRGTRGG